MTITEVLADTNAHERNFLLANPWDLGLRCEAYLAGAAPEWYVANGLLGLADRTLLEILVEGTLLEGPAPGFA